MGKKLDGHHPLPGEQEFQVHKTAVCSLMISQNFVIKQPRKQNTFGWFEMEKLADVSSMRPLGDVHKTLFTTEKSALYAEC